MFSRRRRRLMISYRYLGRKAPAVVCPYPTRALARMTFAFANMTFSVVVHSARNAISTA